MPRLRLTGQLDGALASPLTLIVAPAGYGKTTLLTGWHAAQANGTNGTGRSLAWLALDAGDDNLGRFLHYFVAAVQTLRVGLAEATHRRLRTSDLLPIEPLLTGLLNEIASLPGQVVFVLDDYHVISNPEIHNAVTFLIDHAPPLFHLIISTRADPPLPLPRLRARGQLVELRAGDLRFTTDEAAAFLNLTMGIDVAADDLAGLEARTEGWAAGLQLAALTLRGRDPARVSEAVLALTGNHRFIFDYLAAEVYERQPDHIQRFLLHTSVLDRLTGKLCDRLLGEYEAVDLPANGREMLEQLEQANLFLIPLDDSRTWYRYHHLFGDFLRTRLEREQPGLLAELHRRASSWYEEQEHWAEAVNHALAARDYPDAARLIERAIQPILWQRGELGTVLGWVALVPREIAHSRPRLCLDLAWSELLAARYDAVEPWLQDAEAAIDRFGLDRLPLTGEITSMRAELARQRGDNQSAIVLAQQALADLLPDARRSRSLTTLFLGHAYLSLGAMNAAAGAYAEAVVMAQSDSTIAMTLIGSGRLVEALALSGQLRQASATYERTLRLATAHQMENLPAIGPVQVGMAEVLRERNELAQARHLAQQGIAHSLDASGLAQMVIDGSLILARIEQARGDITAALAALDRAEAFGTGQGQGRRLIDAAERIAVARARLWLTTDPPDLTAARSWAEQRRRVAGDIPDFLSLLQQLTLARLYLLDGRQAEAASLLPRLLEQAEVGSLVGCMLEVLALQARLAFARGDIPQALAALSRMLERAEPEGYVRPFLDEGSPMLRLLQLARERGLARAQVARLLDAFGTDLVEPTPLRSNQPFRRVVDPLSSRELELLRWLAAGLTTDEIAAQLFISSATVRTHLKNIYGKLDVHSRLQAVERARSLNML